MAARVRQIVETPEIARRFIRAGCEILSRLDVPPDQIEAMIREIRAAIEVRVRAAGAVNHEQDSNPPGDTSAVREAIAQCTELQGYPFNR